MDFSGGFRQLATVVESLQADDVEVHDVTITGDEPAVVDGRLRVSVDLSIPASSRKGGEGGTDVELTVPDDQPDTADDADDREPGEEMPADAASESRRSDGGSTTVDQAGGVACTHPDCDATFDSEPGMKVHRTKVHGGETDDGEPAYRDPERLREVYETHDSFPEMRDALGVSVSAQTVRRHAIKHGIHDESEDAGESAAESATESVDADGDDAEGPSTATDAGSETADGSATTDDSEPDDPAAVDADALVADGSSLADAVPDGVTVPDDVTLRDLRAGVKEADTLYDVQQAFGTDRETARELLSAFDLLDLVHGRVATKRERDERKSEVDRRIRRSIGENGAS